MMNLLPKDTVIKKVTSRLKLLKVSRIARLSCKFSEKLSLMKLIQIWSKMESLVVKIKCASLGNVIIRKNIFPLALIIVPIGVRNNNHPKIKSDFIWSNLNSDAGGIIVINAGRWSL